MISIEFDPDGRPYRNPLGREICKKDGAWFKKHPLRRHYIRQALPGEFPEARRGEHWFAAIRQLQPGIRRRHGFQWFGDAPPDDLFEGERIAEIIFDFFVANGGRFVPWEELRAHVLSHLLASIPPEGNA